MNCNNYKNRKIKAKIKVPTKYIIKLMFTIILTLIVLILIKANASFKTKFYEIVFEKNFKFSSVNNIYKKYIGTSLPLKNFIKDTEPVFNEKLTYSAVSKYNDAALLSVSSNYLIPALESGLVVFVGQKEPYGNVVIVQQVNGVDLWYGNINIVDVKLYDYIEKGSLIGECNEELYVLFKKDGKILNYEDYI